MELLPRLKKYIVFCAVSFLVLGVVVILCDAMTNMEDERSLKARQSSTAFWIGLPYLVVGCLLFYMSQVQKSMNVNACKFFNIAIFVLSMLALVFEGPDWNYYLNYKNYVCDSGSETLCRTSGNLSGLFGTITVAVTIATLLSISNILICNWLLFRMTVETPEKDFDREDVKRSTLSESDVTDDVYKAQGYYAGWNDADPAAQSPPRKHRIEKSQESNTKNSELEMKS